MLLDLFRSQHRIGVRSLELVVFIPGRERPHPPLQALLLHPSILPEARRDFFTSAAGFTAAATNVERGRMTERERIVEGVRKMDKREARKGMGLGMEKGMDNSRIDPFLEIPGEDSFTSAEGHCFVCGEERCGIGRGERVAERSGSLQVLLSLPLPILSPSSHECSEA